MTQCYLLAAGFSYQFGMPLASDLTEVFLSIFDKEYITLLADGLSKTFPYGEEYPLSRDALFEAFELLLSYKEKNEQNYELIINAVKNLTKPSTSQSERHSYEYVFGILYGIIHTILVDYQKAAFHLYQSNKEPYRNFKNLINQNEETWIFTLNHDLFMEYLALDFDIPISFGDSHQISFRQDNRENFNKLIKLTYTEREELTLENLSFQTDEYGVNLVKLHGGLNELKYKDGQYLCNLSLDVENATELSNNFNDMMEMCHYLPNGEKLHSAQDWIITNMDNELDIAAKSMLTGGDKYSISYSQKKGEEKLILFSKKLEKIDTLTIIGYGFNDRHINNKIYRALILNPQLKIKIVDPYAKYPDCLLEFKDSIQLIRSDVANWIYYEENSTDTEHKWNPELIPYNDAIKSSREILKIAIMRMVTIKYRPSQSIIKTS